MFVVQQLVRVVTLLAITLAVGCGSSEASDRSAPPVAPAADDRWNAAAWGPLAVWRDRGPTSVPAIGYGAPAELRIGKRCVTLVEADYERTLVFNNKRVEWKAKARAILTHPTGAYGGSDALLRDGDWIQITSAKTRSGNNDLLWVAEPHPTCPPRQRIVFDVKRAPGNR